MKRIRSILPLLVVLLLTITTSLTYASGTISEQITTAIQAGNAAGVSKFFNSMVDLTVPGFDDSYSKTQAGQILKEFFSEYPVKSFKVSREGSSPDGSRYVIGTLETTKKSFRVYFLLKTVNGEELIHQFQVQDS